MRGFVRFVARLYPAAWRERYGMEFDALLEEASLNWRDLPDVLRGVLEMHMRTWGFPKIAVLCGLAGTIVAAGLAFRMPNRYVSTAVIAIEWPNGNIAVGQHLKRVLEEALSRSSISEMIRKDDPDPIDTGRPFGDVIERMRRDIRVVLLDGSDTGEPKSFAVQYVHGDPTQAQRTTHQLISKLMEVNLMENRSATVPSMGLTLKLLNSASLPRTPASPNRLMITTLGTGLGLLLAVLAALAMRLHTRAVQI